MIVVTVLVCRGVRQEGPAAAAARQAAGRPADLTAARRADTVDLQFTVPNANTDNTRPANVARVDVYAFTGPATVSEAEVLKQGTKVASIAVKAPRDPDATFDPDDPEQSEGGRRAAGRRRSGSGRRGARPGNADRAGSRAAPADATPPRPPVRTYVGVGITTRGRRGPSSRRAAVPLVPPPPAPSKPEVTYTETCRYRQWPPAAHGGGNRGRIPRVRSDGIVGDAD